MSVAEHVLAKTCSRHGPFYRPIRRGANELRRRSTSRPSGFCPQTPGSPSLKNHSDKTSSRDHTSTYKSPLLKIPVTKLQKALRVLRALCVKHLCAPLSLRSVFRSTTTHQSEHWALKELLCVHHSLTDNQQWKDIACEPSDKTTEFCPRKTDSGHSDNFRQQVHRAPKVHAVRAERHDAGQNPEKEFWPPVIVFNDQRSTADNGQIDHGRPTTDFCPTPNE
jgi:hypothetical protein